MCACVYAYVVGCGAVACAILVSTCMFVHIGCADAGSVVMELYCIILHTPLNTHLRWKPSTKVLFPHRVSASLALVARMQVITLEPNCTLPQKAQK